MGHSTAHATFAAAEADKIRATNPTQNRYYRISGDEALVTEAVSRWRNLEASRFDNERTTVPVVLPLCAPSVSDAASYASLESGTTFILSLAAEADVIRKTFKMKVEATADEMPQLRKLAAGDSWGLRSIASVEKGLAEFGFRVENAKVVAVPAARKPTAKATDGKMVTRYKVVSPDKWGRVGTVSVHDSLAQARQAALHLMTANPALSSIDVEAVVVRVNEAGEANTSLLTVTRPEPNPVVTIEVTTVVPKPGAKAEKYLVGFDYHH